MPDHPLDNPAWFALTTQHASFADIVGRARRYPADVSVFSAVDVIDDQSLADLDVLTADGPVVLFGAHVPDLPHPWTPLHRGGGRQMTVTAEALRGGAPVDARVLTIDDAPQMVDLVALTEPGPFCARTVEMGRYVGHFDGERLLAMAGERLHLDGFTEISAVCTHPDARGRGLAAALTGLVAEGILERGEQPFLHVAHGNDAAKRVYDAMGFVQRGLIQFARFDRS